MTCKGYPDLGLGMRMHLLQSQWLGIVGPSQQENLAIAVIATAKEQLPFETEPEKNIRQRVLRGTKTYLV